jgi:hypothetical protein
MKEARVNMLGINSTVKTRTSVFGYSRHGFHTGENKKQLELQAIDLHFCIELIGIECFS